MKITIVTAYFRPEISPVTHLYADLAADLAAYGADVTVVTGPAVRGLDEETRAAYRTRTDERAPEGYRILRTGGGREGTNFLLRGLRLLFCAWALYRTAKRVPTDAYLLGSMPPFLGLIGARLNQRARTVYVLQDIFPDSMLLMGRFSESHPVVRLCRRMERVSYAGNTRFITISEDMAETLGQRGVARARITVVPNWADCAAVRPVARADNPLFDELELKRDAFIVLYAGTLGALQCPDVLLDAAKLLDGRGEVLFVLLGGGGLYAHIERRIAAERLGNVRLFPLQPPERAGEVYSIGDVAVVPLAAGVTRVAMPSKTWTAMAAARPLLITADSGSAWARAVKEAGCGYCAAPGDAQSLAGAVETAYRNRARLPEMGALSRAYAQARLDRKAATRQYYETLQKP